MNIHTDFVGLLLDGVGGKGHLLINYYPTFFSLSFFHYTEYSILVWESINNSTMKVNGDIVHIAVIPTSNNCQSIVYSGVVRQNCNH